MFFLLSYSFHLLHLIMLIGVISIIGRIQNEYWKETFMQLKSLVYRHIPVVLDSRWWDYVNSPKIWQETNIAGLAVITCYVNVGSWKFDNCFCSITRVWCLQWEFFIYHVPISCLTNRIEFIVTKMLFCQRGTVSQSRKHPRNVFR